MNLLLFHHYLWFINTFYLFQIKCTIYSVVVSNGVDFFCKIIQFYKVISYKNLENYLATILIIRIAKYTNFFLLTIIKTIAKLNISTLGMGEKW